MRKLALFLGLLIALFNVSSALGGSSLKELLTQFEVELKKGAPQELLEKRLAQIERAKEGLPVYHLPELNYLTEREVEKVPPSRISTIKAVLFALEPLKRAVEVMLFFLLFFTLIFYFQHTDFEPEVRRIATLAAVMLLAITVLLDLKPLFLLLCGAGAVLALAAKKRRTALFLFLGGNLLIFLTAITQNLSHTLTSPQLLYKVKTERDGYSPEYLTERALIEPLKVKVEKATTDLALGELEAVKTVQSLKTEEPTLKGIILNDIGYYYYMKGQFKEALKAFEKARELLDSPVVLFNLYLTYSSLLMVEKANQIKEELLKKKVDVSKASPVPLLIHVPAQMPPIQIPFLLALALLLGVGVGLLTDRVMGFYAENINQEVLLLPGMRSFINSRFQPFLLLFGAALLINFLLGRAVCSM